LYLQPKFANFREQRCARAQAGDDARVGIVDELSDVLDISESGREHRWTSSGCSRSLDNTFVAAKSANLT
jgi:hypothetical protein